ncbi:MAG: MBL fold metallo-hydrolase [Acidimicrobiia bacterium]|nr:MBL fold metallo-hydrolase [Acidimicrobiia bacterium]
MTTIRRLTDSCLIVTTDDGATLLDPGFHTFGSGEIDLGSIGDIQRVLVTHGHGDHASPEFVRWLIDRGDGLQVHANQAVADLLAPHDIEVVVDDPPGVSSEDVLHEMTPMGTTPPNRAFTVEQVLTHPGDSYQPTRTAPVLALPLLIPWGSTFQSMEFARRLMPQQVVSIHDFYLSESGREWISTMATNVLAKSDIEFIALDWGDSYTL